jgi:hypothetical protein
MKTLRLVVGLVRAAREVAHITAEDGPSRRRDARARRTHEGPSIASGHRRPLHAEDTTRDEQRVEGVA